MREDTMPRAKLSNSSFREVIRAERHKLTLTDLCPGKIMLSLSGGDASAVAFFRARQRWGERVTAVFADTCSEDEDAYRLIDDCERLIGPVVWLRQYNEDGTGMDIWDCFDKHGIMRIPKAGNACKASVELKQKPLDAYAKSEGFTFLAIGYSFTEPERMLKLSAKKREIVIYPLVADPLLSECDIHDELRRIGIEPARIYDDGFTHNNCIAAGGCILSGLAQYAAIAKLKPKESRPKPKEQNNRLWKKLEKLKKLPGKKRKS